MFNDTRMTRQAARVIARKTVNFLRGYLDPWEREDIPPVGDLAETLYTRRGAVVAYLQGMWEDALSRRDQDGMKGLEGLINDINHPMWAVWALEEEAKR